MFIHFFVSDSEVVNNNVIRLLPFVHTCTEFVYQYNLEILKGFVKYCHCHIIYREVNECQRLRKFVISICSTCFRAESRSFHIGQNYFRHLCHVYVPKTNLITKESYKCFCTHVNTFG